MRIVLFCATRRGYRFAEKLLQMQPDAEFIVFSFREDPWEPPFLDDIYRLTVQAGGQFYESKQVGAERWQELWASTPVDLMFSVSWRFMIPPAVYQQARLGAYVFHDSLLPEYRGFAPTVWAMINGENHTGATLFEMVEAVDAGGIVGQQPVTIGPDETIAQVMERVTDAYLHLLDKHLPALIAGTAVRTPQDDTQATYTCKLLPEDFQIDWQAPTERTYNLIRATTKPYVGAYTSLNGQRLRIWQAQKLPETRMYVGRIPGRVIDIRPGEGVVVLTGDDRLLITHAQLEDGDILPADEIINRYAYTLGR